MAEGGRLVDHPTVKQLKDGQLTGPANSFALLSLLGDAEATGGAHGLDLGAAEAEEAAAGADVNFVCASSYGVWIIIIPVRILDLMFLCASLFVSLLLL